MAAWCSIIKVQHPQQKAHILTSLVKRYGPFILAQMAPCSRPLKTVAYLEDVRVWAWLCFAYVCLCGAHPCTWVHGIDVSLHLW